MQPIIEIPPVNSSMNEYIEGYSEECSEECIVCGDKAQLCYDSHSGNIVCEYCGTVQTATKPKKMCGEICKACGSIGEMCINKEQGEISCKLCGMIQDDRIIHDGEDWSNYESNRESGKDNSRVGWSDASNPYSTLGSYLAKGNKSWGTVRTKEGKIIKFDLIKISQIVSSNHKEKAFYEVIKKFDELVYAGYINQVTVDLAKKYWNEIVKNKRIFRGGNRKGILACCVLYATYSNFCSKSRDQIAEYMLISKDEIVKGEPVFKDIIANSQYKDILSKGITVKDIFSPLIDKLNLPYKFVGKCNDVYFKCEEELSEISSSAAIAGVISFVVNVQEDRKTPTKKQITDTVGITNPTMTNALKIISAKLS